MVTNIIFNSFKRFTWKSSNSSIPLLRKNVLNPNDCLFWHSNLAYWRYLISSFNLALLGKFIGRSHAYLVTETKGINSKCVQLYIHHVYEKSTAVLLIVWWRRKHEWKMMRDCRRTSTVFKFVKNASDDLRVLWSIDIYFSVPNKIP